MLYVLIQGSKRLEILLHCIRESNSLDALLLPSRVPDWANYLHERDFTFGMRD